MTTKNASSDHQPTDNQESVQFSETERNAMRAYLQRCEVRLSTLHRIAQAFFGGAGLLVLIPVFFKDAIDNLLVALLGQMHNHFPTLGTGGLLLTIILFLSVLYPLLLSLSVPLYGVYLLLKDIIHFYFTIYSPGFPQDLMNPSFALTGLMFSVDESETAKREVMRYQYQATQAGFMIPFSKERSELYFDSIIEKSHGNIIPETRTILHLEALGVLPPNYKADQVDHFNAALGMVRGLDRTLVEEVAVTEMALARHILYLRRLVLRYVKTLLMFIWTTVISFMMLPLIKNGRIPAMLIMALGYLVWSLAVTRIMGWPIYWIYRHLHQGRTNEQVDPQLRLMEERVGKYTYLAIALSILAAVLSTIAYLN